jgi:hypothetical protein
MDQLSPKVPWSAGLSQSTGWRSASYEPPAQSGLDWLLILNEQHLKYVLADFVANYDGSLTGLTGRWASSRPTRPVP